MKNKWLTIVQWFLIGSFLPFFFINRSDVSASVVLSWAVILIAVGICVYHGLKNIVPSYSKKTVISSIVLSLLFLTMLSFDAIIKSSFLVKGYFTASYGQGADSFLRIWLYVVYMLSVILSVWICIHSVCTYALCVQSESRHTRINSFSGMSDREESNHLSSEKKMRYLCFGILVGCSLLSLLSTFPGIWVSDDVATVWRYVSEKQWDDWHPFPYLLFVNVCKSIYNSTFSVNVVQTLFWIGINYYALKVLQEIDAKCMVVYTAVLCISTTPFTYLEVMFKDTLFAMGILGVTIALLRVIRKKEMTWLDFAVFNACGLMVTLFRHAGNVAMFAACIACGIFFWKNRKIMLQFVVSFVVQAVFFALFYVVLFQMYDVTSNPLYVKYGTPMAMIGAAVQDGMTFDASDQEQLEKVMPLEDWGNCYNKYWADSISRNYGSIGDRINTVEDLLTNEGYGSFLIQMNLKILVKNPRLYLRAFFDMSSILWEMGKPIDSDAIMVSPLCQVPASEDIRYTSFFGITDTWSRFLNDMPLTNALFQRGGFSIFAIVMVMTILVLKKKWKYLLVIVPIVVTDMLLFITIPAQDPRYALPTIECAIFLLALFPVLRKKCEK